MLSRRSPASQPRGVRGESGAFAREAAVRSRSSGGRLRLEPPPAPTPGLPPAPRAQGAREGGEHRGRGATRATRMDAGTWRLGWRCLLLLALLGSTRSEGVESCDEVRKLFQWRLGGAVKGLPDAPRAGRSWPGSVRGPGRGLLGLRPRSSRHPEVVLGPDLQVCITKNPTCCNRKMEERYQIAARQDLQQVLQTSSSTLKLLISRNAAAFQETLETLIRQAENYTSILFCNTYRNMALEAAASIQEFFTDVGLYLFGADVNPEEFVNRFFDSLFPLVYNHLINPGATDSSLQYSECIRMARQDVSPFGNIPKRVMGQMGRSLLPSRTFLQALNLGIEVINTTDHIHFSKECNRALLRMQYCSHCQSLMLSKPCMGYCLNVVRGCLAHMTELNPHWHAYIRSLEELSDAMHGTYDIEHVLLNFHLLVNDAVLQAHLNGQKLLDQVNKICGHPVRTTTQSPRCTFDPSKEKHGMKISARNGEETLANRRKEFINSLRLHRSFYGGLADQLCINELAAAEGSPCWNGEDVVKSYSQRVVGNGIRAQSGNPEVRVRGPDPVINQIIDKLKHVIQLLQGRSPKPDKWELLHPGSGGGVLEQASGDCDDEDGCGGSGSGEVKRTLKITNCVMAEHLTSSHKASCPLEKKTNFAESSPQRSGLLLMVAGPLRRQLLICIPMS
ncbi:glypican-5 isoform X4 [Meriones unguiculatus]|uniref:glypican-5 isoform X4 n=1 Tax=Meriones unguiculatus TaxID=10047 RepID=UPI00293E1AFD|nr:glypican-5 isoform X4 [Meriones unguiculatus]